MRYDWEWQPYVSVAERRRDAEREKATLRKAGRTLAPVVIAGRAIARTFWGTAWCKNLESYSDYANRLPRGRTYVRNRCVLHLEIAAGSVKALVRGSSLYQVTIAISPVPKARWSSICGDSAGAIDSLVELLQGRFSKSIMERLCRQQSGLFPAPREITLDCSCPDSASMCKHVAAVLYGVGARLDDEPELLFRLRKVDEKDLIAKADGGARLAKRGASKDKVLANANLAELFGLSMGVDDASDAKAAVKRKGSAGAKRKSARLKRIQMAATKPETGRKKAARKEGPRERSIPRKGKAAGAGGKSRTRHRRG
jgi:uncharacterized Zn finger protein